MKLALEKKYIKDIRNLTNLRYADDIALIADNSTSMRTTLLCR